MVVRFKDLESDFLTMVEMICPEISTRNWKYLFSNFTAEDPKILSECKLAKTLHFEDETFSEKFETSIRVFQFPLVN